VIVKEKDLIVATSAQGKAGEEAEKQMAFYLKREFAKDADVFVFNDLRLIHDGEVAQIDHFVLHKYGFALIESKSVAGTVEINEYGEWIRMFNNKPSGMPSPVLQLERQQDILKNKLEANAPELLGKLIGLQKRFGGRKYDQIVAISDKTRIVRKQSTEDIHKADAVAGILRNQIKEYKRGRITADTVCFNKKEMQALRRFFLAEHCEKASLTDRKPVGRRINKEKKAKSVSNEMINTEKHDYWYCQCGQEFEIRHKYNFYKYCLNCRKPLPFDPVCLICNSEAVLSQPENTRIVTYQCESVTEHHGVFHANSKRHKKDEATLRSKT